MQQLREGQPDPQDPAAEPLEAAAVGEVAVDLSKAMKLSQQVASTASVKAAAPRPDTDAWDDVLLLFEKLQLELVLASGAPTT